MVCVDNCRVIQPRNSKSLEEQKNRINEKAEVFTTAWICNSQNNLFEKVWFKTNNDVFNSELEML